MLYGIMKTWPKDSFFITLTLLGLINFPTSAFAKSIGFTLNIRFTKPDDGSSSPSNDYVETADNEAWARNGRLFLDGTGKYSKAYFKMDGRHLVHDPSGDRVGYGFNNRLVRGGTPLEWTIQETVYPNDPKIHHEIELGYRYAENTLITCSRFSPAAEILVVSKSSLKSMDLNGCLFVTFVFV